MSDASSRLKQAVVGLERARMERDEAVREADAEGMKHREISSITGLTNQQVHTIIKSATASND